MTKLKTLKDDFRRLGNSDGIGKSYRIGNYLDFGMKKVRGRREFFDLVRDYIKEKGLILEINLMGYIQYTTGASATSIKQALAVLESIEIIDCVENNEPPFERSWKMKEDLQEKK